MNARPVEEITYEDWIKYPLWEFISESEFQDETYMLPSIQLPVENFDGRLLSCPIILSNGQVCHGLLGNINTTNTEFNPHLITLSFVIPDGRFNLARYHDYDYHQNGPESLAEFLGLPISEIFPISYAFDPSILIGATGITEYLDQVPEKKLSRAEIIELALRDG